MSERPRERSWLTICVVIVSLLLAGYLATYPSRERTAPRVIGMAWPTDRKPNTRPAEANTPMLVEKNIRRNAALARGKTLLACLERNPDDAFLLAEAIVGTEVALYGSGLPPGGNADLCISETAVARITMLDDADPRPMAVMWTADVLGIVDGIDLQNRQVHLSVQSGNWTVLDTW